MFLSGLQNIILRSFDQNLECVTLYWDLQNLVFRSLNESLENVTLFDGLLHHTFGFCVLIIFADNELLLGFWLPPALAVAGIPAPTGHSDRQLLLGFRLPPAGLIATTQGVTS